MAELNQQGEEVGKADHAASSKAAKLDLRDAEPITLTFLSMHAEPEHIPCVDLSRRVP